MSAIDDIDIRLLFRWSVCDVTLEWIRLFFGFFLYQESTWYLGERTHS